MLRSFSAELEALCNFLLSAVLHNRQPCLFLRIATLGCLLPILGEAA